MRRTHILYTLIIAFTWNFASAQFVSVKDGNWRDPQTWSVNPEATAIPDSTSNVTVAHNVIVSTSATELSVCYNLTIDSTGTLDNYSSAIIDGSILIKNDLINWGSINPAYDLYLFIEGDFYNNGIITKHYISEDQKLYILGNIYNSGTFNFTHTYFSKGDLQAIPVEHTHHLRSFNDSTMVLGDVHFMDSLGTIVIDSLAIISANINLNKSKIVLAPEITHPNILIFDTVTLYGGQLEANHNPVQTKEASWAYLGNYTGDIPDMVFIDAQLQGNFVSGGVPAHNQQNSRVIFKGETTFQGKLADWYTSGLYSGDRGIFIDGTFVNNGRIYDATSNNGLYLNQMHNSTLAGTGSLDNKALNFSGTCNFSTADSLSAASFGAEDSLTVVNITQGDIFFKKTVTVDFNGGTLNLAEGTKFYTTYQWYNSLRNININGNHADIKFAMVKENVQIHNPRLMGVYFSGDALLTGSIEVPAGGYVYPAADHSHHIVIDGDIINYGTIANHSTPGLLYLEVLGNIVNDGIAWSNSEIKLNGQDDQHILMPQKQAITGKVILDAMLSGSTYQWKKDGVDIPEATSQNLNFNAGVNESHYGEYVCSVDGFNSRKIIINDSLRTVTGLQQTDNKSIFPDEYKLSQNYPNPFNPSTRIAFSTAKDVLVKIDLFNSNGQYINTIYNRHTSTGSYEFTFNADNLTSGIYYYKITAGDFQKVRKMMLIK